MQILIEPTGKVFLSFDKQGDMIAALKGVSARYGIDYAAELDKNSGKVIGTNANDIRLLNTFKVLSTFGTSIDYMKEFLAKETSDQDKELSKHGIPTEVDTTIVGGLPRGQFEFWISEARAANEDLRIAIKADQNTPYKVIKDVMASLQHLKENRYNLITSLKQGNQ
jgi:biopolymer transport protein ExbD